jgi:hypothetical protein
MIIKFFNTFDGVWSDITGTANQSLVYSETSGWVTARPFKVYAATFNQTGTNDPTTKIHQNTIGEIEWTRLNLGSYQGELIGGFTGDVPKQTSLLGFNGSSQSIWMIIEKINDDYVKITTKVLNVKYDNLLTDSFFEFKVY